ncbi:hypothetical protein [Agromyces bracchium]|uniref:DUF3558 domain-containing protein n=1 Tax=Agromyces bracchium TaxID=88376 RepID=A0A6I3M2A2_9MICO|nr:hypothetical protein [Agromyces bracchium]MTH66951.1 hypothetical protein [Agromyces bracchium]
MNRHAVPIAAASLALAAVLAGCTTTPRTDPSPSPATSPATLSPEPTTAPEAEPTCEDVLVQAEYDRLASSGLTARQDAFPLGQAMIDLVDDGALHCIWAADQSDVALWVARLPESDEAWAARQSELLAAGWTEADEPFTGTLTAPPDYDANYQPAMVHVDGVTYFVSTDDVLTSVADLA